MGSPSLGTACSDVRLPSVLRARSCPSATLSGHRAYFNGPNGPPSQETRPAFATRETRPMRRAGASGPRSANPLPRLEEAEVHGVADAALAVEPARVREARIHDDHVARLERDRHRISAVERPHDEPAVALAACGESDSDDAAVGPPRGPVGLLVDVRLERGVGGLVRKLKDELRVANLALAELVGKMVEQRDDLRVPLQMREPVC